MTDKPGAEASSSPARPMTERYRNWQAIANFQPIVSQTPLRVGGDYFLNQRCGGVRLEVKVPQGINPRILLLDLVDGPGDGGDWVAVEGHFEASPGQYDSVTVIDSDGESVSIEVEEVN